VLLRVVAVDVQRASLFWRRFGHDVRVELRQGTVPSVELVFDPLCEDIASEVESLLRFGGSVVEERDGEVVVADPEGNRFVLAQDNETDLG
jgi:hypothetical protein